METWISLLALSDSSQLTETKVSDDRFLMM